MRACVLSTHVLSTGHAISYNNRLHHNQSKESPTFSQPAAVRCQNKNLRAAALLGGKRAKLPRTTGQCLSARCAMVLKLSC